MRDFRLIVGLGVLLASGVLHADDWPQWMGPQRDNIWRETGIVKSFPEDGLTVKWRVPVAGGYSSPTVAEGRVYVTDFVKNEEASGDNFDRDKLTGTERVHCFDQRTGKTLWTHDYPVTYTISYPAGPRCAPLVHEGLVYTLGAEGLLIAFEADSGEIVWQVDLKERYQTTAPIWGYAAHPLIDGDKLITLAGGEGTQAVALNRLTGEEIWRALSSPEVGQGYSPPSIIESGGARQLLIAQPNALSGLDPETGKVHWSVEYQGDNGTIIMTPRKVGDHIFMGSYTQRNLLVKLDPNALKAETVWRDKARHGISPINTQPFVDGDVLYGCDQSGKLMAIQLPEGNRLWETPEPVSKRPVGNGTAMFVRHAETGNYWFFTESGDLVIAQLSPEGYEEIDRTHVIEPTNRAGRPVVWCAPAYADKHFFIRNDKECLCVDLSAAQ